MSMAIKYPHWDFRNLGWFYLRYLFYSCPVHFSLTLTSTLGRTAQCFAESFCLVSATIFLWWTHSGPETSLCRSSRKLLIPYCFSHCSSAQRNQGQSSKNGVLCHMVLKKEDVYNKIAWWNTRPVWLSKSLHVSGALLKKHPFECLSVLGKPWKPSLLLKNRKTKQINKTQSWKTNTIMLSYYLYLSYPYCHPLGKRMT